MVETQVKPSEEVVENPATFEGIKSKLEEHKIEFKLTTHEPVLTS